MLYKYNWTELNWIASPTSIIWRADISLAFWEREFYSAEVAESRTGFSLFNDGAGGLGMGIWGYDRRYLWIVFKWWGRWGGDAAVLHCAGWERGSPMLSHFLPSVGLLHCVYPPTLWQWKKAGQALALLVNEALTSLAHTHTQTHTVRSVTNSILTPFVLSLLYLIHVWLPGEGAPRVIEIFRDVRC